MGLAGAEQLAKLERTRTSTGSSFVAEQVVKPAALLAKLADPPDPLTQALQGHLPAKVRKQLREADAPELIPRIASLLARALNKLAAGPSLYDATRFPDRILSKETRELRPQTLVGKKLAQFNRLLLRDAFPEEIDTKPQIPTPSPFWESSSASASRCLSRGLRSKRTCVIGPIRPGNRSTTVISGQSFIWW